MNEENFYNALTLDSPSIGEYNVRRIWHEEQWFFSVIDAVAALTKSKDPADYWYYVKNKEQKESEIQLSGLIRQLKLPSSDGKRYKTDCANLENLFRIVQSIPSPEAEPLKRWLAKVGAERIEEIANPELAGQRMRSLYKKKGYSDQWINARERGITKRDELTDEWKTRGIKKPYEFAILTAEVAKATFGLTPTEHKELKGLKRENLRDNMSDLELIFAQLGEASTIAITQTRDTQGFVENKQAAIDGGSVAGNARLDLESKINRQVVTADNATNIAALSQLPIVLRIDSPLTS